MRRSAARPASRPGLFELFKGPHWTLLGYDVERAGVWRRDRDCISTHSASAATSSTLTGTSATPMRCAGDWVLVRPDGYVGAVVANSNLEALDDYLQQVGLARLWF